MDFRRAVALWCRLLPGSPHGMVQPSLAAARGSADILVVLPFREAVASARAGAVALTVGEFCRASRFRTKTEVVGGTEPGDFDLAYTRLDIARRSPLTLAWPFWRRTSERYAAAVLDHIAAGGTKLVEVHNQAPLFHHLARRLHAGVRLSLHLHNDPHGMAGLRTASQRSAILERASRVYCVSRYVRDRFVDGLRGPLERVVVLHNGVELPPEPAADRQQEIVFVGRLIAEKGVDALIGALRDLAAQLPEWRVQVIGHLHEREHARYGQALDDLAQVWGGRLLRHGVLPHREVMRAMSGAAVVLVPSVWPEPFGRVALEAMAAGAAVVSSRAGGLPEIVADAGLLLDDVTPATLAEAVLSLVRDPGLRSRLGRAGRKIAAERFDVPILAGRLDAWRAEILGRYGT